MKRTINRHQGLFALIGAVLMILVGILSYVNCYLAGLIGILGAAGLYFTWVLSSRERDYLQLGALFMAVWVVTISLGQMQLCGYQEQWLPKTWVCMILAYIFFELGTILSRPAFAWILKRRHAYRGSYHRIRMDFSRSKLFWFCAVGSAISLLCFVINIAIRGYVPFFSTIPNAYLHFYTRFYVISVAGTILAGPCYYCIKTCKLQTWQKVLLYVCIAYNAFVFPILVVSRGTFISAAISLSCAIYYLNKKQLKVLICCLIVMFGVYFMCSNARNYSDAQLNEFFETDQEPEEEEEKDDELHSGLPDQYRIQISGKVAFVYSYLTVAHDNMNEAVEHCTEYTYGLRQLNAFTAVLRFPALEQALADCEYYLVRDHLNTINVMGDAYYDFGIFGMILMPLLWAFAFGLMQEAFKHSGSAHSLLALGNTVSVVALSFFGTWMSYFTTWMFWGVALLLLLLCGLKVNKVKTA